MESYFLPVLMLIIIWVLNRNFAIIKGWIGERHVSNILSSFPPQDYTLMNDLYIPKENGQTTQIDHLLISPKGIIVIETKNYKGWITGSEHSQYWTQTNYKAERYDWILPKKRRTLRAEELLRKLAFSTSYLNAEKLSNHLHLPVSKDT